MLQIDLVHRPTESESDVHRLLTTGRFALARQHLEGAQQRLKDPRVKSAEQLRLLSQMRDCGLADEALSAASSLIETSVGPERAAFAVERARALLRLGALREAGQRLERDPILVAAQETISYQIARIHLHVARWEYDLALPRIDKALANPDVDVRDRASLVAARTAALVFMGQWTRAEASFVQADGELEEIGAVHLRFRLHEILAQMLWEQGRHRELKEVLVRAQSLLESAPWIDGAFTRFSLQRWETLAEQPDANEGRQAGFATLLSELRKRAHDLGLWETIRDLDLVALQILRDEIALARLYFMTPFPTFRAYLDRICRSVNLPVPNQAVIEVGAAAVSPITFEVATGRFSNGSQFKPGGLNYRILASLLRDAYRPLRTAELFHELHPDEYYSPSHSSRRVQQALRRFKAALTEAGIPLALDSLGGATAILTTESRLVLDVPKTWLTVDSVERASAVDVHGLAVTFGSGRLFSAQEAARAWDRPLRSAQTTLAELVERDYLHPEGVGPARRYRLRLVN